jgi:hypothetical protein
MAITIENTLSNNQSILQNIALVEELDEQAAEIISGGKSLNGSLPNKQISGFEDKKGEEDEPEIGTVQQANLTFGLI